MFYFEVELTIKHVQSFLRKQLMSKLTRGCASENNTKWQGWTRTIGVPLE